METPTAPFHTMTQVYFLANSWYLYNSCIHLLKNTNLRISEKLNMEPWDFLDIIEVKLCMHLLPRISLWWCRMLFDRVKCPQSVMEYWKMRTSRVRNYCYTTDEDPKWCVGRNEVISGRPRGTNSKINNIVPPRSFPTCIGSAGQWDRTDLLVLWRGPSFCTLTMMNVQETRSLGNCLMQSYSKERLWASNWSQLGKVRSMGAFR